jgi:uncharacterized RDD family membrane protein YckC
MTTVDETLIGEGVALDTAAASLGSRTAAALLDAVIIITVYIVLQVGVAAIMPPGLDFAAATAISLTLVIGCLVGIPVTVETITRGRSVGKLVLGIRIVRDDGGPIAFRQAFVRGLSGLFELWMTVGGVALLTSASSQRGKRLGDMMGGTYALRTRAAGSQHTWLEVPYSLAEWASTVDVRRLPDGLALAIRQFLTRAPKLHPTSRRELGESLASQLSPFVSPPPPAGTHPETFMTAVLAVRRDREYQIEVRNLAADAEQAKAVHRLPFGITEPE